MCRARIISFLAIFLSCVLAITACSSPATPAPNARIQIVATTTQLQDILQNLVRDPEVASDPKVASERMVVIGLLPRNADPHEFQPTPEDVRKITTSQAVFRNGAGLESWLDKLIENAGGERPIFDATRGLTLDTVDRSFQQGGETDPHVWMDPRKMQDVVDNLVVGLTQIDPPGATLYQSNGEAYKTKLRELDAWAEQQVATIPPAQRQLVTAHDALGYFAKRYGFKVVGYVVPSVSTEGQTSAQQLAQLVDQIKLSGVKTVFAEKSSNPNFIAQIAQDANVRIDQLYVDSLGDVGGEAGTYLDFFRADVIKIVNGLK